MGLTLAVMMSVCILSHCSTPSNNTPSTGSAPSSKGMSPTPMHSHTCTHAHTCTAPMHALLCSLQCVLRTMNAAAVGLFSCKFNFPFYIKLYACLMYTHVHEGDTAVQCTCCWDGLSAPFSSPDYCRATMRVVMMTSHSHQGSPRMSERGVHTCGGGEGVRIEVWSVFMAQNTCTHVHVHVHMYMYMYTCTCTCTHVHVHVHTVHGCTCV